MRGAQATAPRTATPLRIEALLQITMATLIVMSTLLLAMGQQNLWYGVVAVVAAVSSLIITDLRGLFSLSPAATSAAALGACLVLVVQVVRNADESQLLNVANILIYLEVILLFQSKEDRTYWSLMTLSLLQVIVAAALNLGLIFGVLLGGYVLVAVAAMTLFYVLRATRPFSQSSVEVAFDGLSNQPRTDQTHAGFTLVRETESDFASQVLNRSLVRQLIHMLAITAVATVFVFFAVPRYSNTVWDNDPETNVATVGFTEEVRLDDITRILESPEQVMRVEFTKLDGTPYEVDGEPYFRGTVLSDYRDAGFWRQFHGDRATVSFARQRPQDLAKICQQTITLQPGSHSVLFNVAPSYPVDATPGGLRLNTHTRQLTLPEDDQRLRGTFQYTLGTSAFRNGWQRDLVPVIRNLELVDGDPSRDFEDDAYWNDRFPAIAQTAVTTLAELGLEQANTFEKAKALEAHFRQPGVYRYSLELNQSRDRQLDPIEDFVANHRTGHCEYFASALTLMLRSQKIPARIVIGYNGGDFNTVGHYYIVRQLHAHAWVEAYLAPDQIPEDEVDSFEDHGLGAWLRLDPTPIGMDVMATNDGLALITTIREIADYCQVLWDDYVLGLNSTRQQQAIYAPINRSLLVIANAVFGEGTWAERWERLQRSVRELLSGRWLRRPVGWVVLTAIVLLAVFRRRIWYLTGSLIDRWPRRASERERTRIRVDFYERFTRLAGRYGYRRAPYQTQLEFATDVAQRLAERHDGGQFAELPRQVTDAYYRVRFGGHSMSREQSQLLKRQLLELEAVLARRTRAVV